MKKIRRKISGQGLVEYALVIALLALVSIAALTGMGSTVSEGLFGGISTNLDDANTTIQNST